MRCPLLLLLASGTTATAASAAVPSVVVEPHGLDSFRVRVAPAGGSVSADTLTALLPGGPNGWLAWLAPAAADAPQTNGNLRVETVDGQRRFTRVSDNKLLLVEGAVEFGEPLPAHTWAPEFGSRKVGF